MTRDVTFLPTNPIMSAVKTEQASFPGPFNQQIQSGKSIFMAPVEAGEYRVVWIIQQRPNGLYHCHLECDVTELIMRDIRVTRIPFTR